MKYPKYKVSKETGVIVKFTSLSTGEVIETGDTDSYFVGEVIDVFVRHDSKANWKKWKPKLQKDKILQENTYVHCLTEAEAYELLVWADNQGLVWADEEKYIKEIEYTNYLHNTCYDIYNGYYDSKVNVLKRGDTLLTMDKVRINNEA